MLSESFLKHAHDWLADSGERGLWPGNRADSIDDLVRLRIDEHLEELFAALRVVRQRSVGEAKPSDIIQAADTVENTATVQGPEPEVADQNRHDGARPRPARAAGTFRPSRCRTVSTRSGRLVLARTRPCRAQSRQSPRRGLRVPCRLLTIPIGPYDNGRSCDSRRNRSMVFRDGRRARNMDPSGGHGIAKQSFTNELVDRDHEPSNRRNTKRQRRRRQELLGKRYQGGRRALV